MAESTNALPSGLSTTVAAARLAETGPNTLPEVAPEPAWRRFLPQFQSLLVYVLLFALAVEGVVWIAGHGEGAPLEAAAIAVILLLNAGLGVWQEWKAEAALAQVGRLTAPRAWTVRDGRLVRIEAVELVPGDVVRVEAGDRIPADATVAASDNLLVDESIVLPAEPATDPQRGDRALRGVGARPRPSTRARRPSTSLPVT